MPFAPSVANMNALISSYNEAAGSSVYNFLQDDTSANWNIMDTNSQSWIDENKFGVSGLRVLITLGDGHVCYDSYDSDINSYANYLSRSINENHNTRISIITAMLSNSGIAYENRKSSTTGTFKNYVAQRTSVTPFTSSAGCIRISFDRPPA